MDDVRARDWLTKEEASAFIGKNTGYYLDKWQRHPDTFYKGWNWAAAIFRVEWLAYRKMYLEAMVAVLLMVVGGLLVDILLALVGLRVPDGLARLAIQILLGALANGLYRKKAVRMLHKTSLMDATQRQDYLHRKGGTSLLALFTLLGLEVAFVTLPWILFG